MCTLRKTNSFVYFLGEVLEWQFCFEIYWPLRVSSKEMEKTPSLHFFLLNRELVKLYHEQLYIVMWLEQLQLIHEMVVFWVPSFNVSVDSWISETFSWTIQFNIVMMWTNTIDSWHGCVLRFFNVAIPGPPWEAHCFQKSQKHTNK